MADFCNKCSAEHGFNVDINLNTVFASLVLDEAISFICEGCAMIAVGRTEDDKCVVYFSEYSPIEAFRQKWFYYDLENHKVLEEYKQLN